ncbi:MAG: MATE family efflux transporter [Verrucomicrobium sp.]|nr:MATE family efflux transporter [Verrucomicrobium sp.]
MLALPLIAGQLGQMLLGISDTIMIGHLGVNELGAATLATTLLIVPFVLGIGLLSSISVRVSQAHGANRPEDARRALRHGTWLAFAFGVITFLLTVALVPFLGFLNQPTEVIRHTPAFLLICSASLIPALISMAWKNHADALNHPWPSFWILLGGVVLDIFLNWLLIWGHWGMPAMGMEGAAVSTLFARILTMVAMYHWLKRSTKVNAWTPRRWWAACDRATFRNLLSIGVPASLQLLTEVTAFSVCTVLIGTLGAVSLAAHQVAINCAAMAFMVPLGVAMALTVRVGEIVGARQHARLHRVLAGGWVFAIGFMSMSMVLFFTCGHWIASQFGSDEGVIAIATRLLIVAGFFQLVDGVQVVSAFALRGVNDVRVPAWTAFVAYWVVAIPLGYFLGLRMGWGPEGMWTGLAVGLGVAAVLLGLRSWKLLSEERAGADARAVLPAPRPATAPAKMRECVD